MKNFMFTPTTNAFSLLIFCLFTGINSLGLISFGLYLLCCILIGIIGEITNGWSK